jgi:prepilin-type N-terminal cleavage/methylation domain-containing protein
MRRRSGFTLVELLVAMALIVFIMAILSEAFTAGLASFRDLKATADMAERLRSVSNMMHRDLAADHFDGDRRISGADFWISERPGLNSPPREGFFRVYQGSDSTSEGSDQSVLYTTAVPQSVFLDSHRAVNHMLHFTVKLKGNERGDYFSAILDPATAAASPLLTSPLLLGTRHYQDSGNVYNSQWAEVVYFLRSVPDKAKGTTQLYSLYRRQRLLVPDNALLSNAAPGTTSQYPEVSCVIGAAANTVYFNNPRDITMPVRRLGMDGVNLAGVFPRPAGPGQSAVNDPVLGTNTYPTMFEDTGNTRYQGADVLLTDVISFEVRVLPTFTQTLGAHFVTLFDTDFSLAANNHNNTTYPAGPGVTTPRVFDTWSNMAEKTGNNYHNWNTVSAAVPASAVTIPFTTAVRLKAVQVIIRVWDSKTEQTRQITIAQDL